MSEASKSRPGRREQLLDARAAHLAKPKATIQTVQMANWAVEVENGGSQYLFRTRDVAGTWRMGRLSTVPFAAEHILGLSRIAGELVAVFDLASLLGSAKPRALQYLLVIHSGKLRCACAIETVKGFTEFSVKSPEKPPHPLLELIDDQGRMLIDIRALIAKAGLQDPI